jgi:hypothetical protein
MQTITYEDLVKKYAQISEDGVSLYLNSCFKATEHSYIFKNSMDCKLSNSMRCYT